MEVCSSMLYADSRTPSTCKVDFLVTVSHNLAGMSTDQPDQ